MDGGIILGGVSLSSPFLFLPPLHASTLTDGGPIFCKIDSNKKINQTKLLMKFWNYDCGPINQNIIGFQRE